MKKIFFSSWLMAGLSIIFCAGLLNAQTVSFNVAGTNPHCKSQYPNGAPYSGSASVSGVEGGPRIKSVTFQIQRWSGSSWGFWGPPFTITPGFSTNTVNYSNSTPGATQLTLTPLNLIRMRAIITYQAPNGSAVTVTVFSSQVQYNYFGAPTLEYEVDELTTSPTQAINVYLCDGGPVVNFNNPPTAASGTGVEWRMLMFVSNSAGAVGVPFSDFENCPWQPGTPNGKFLVDEYLGNGCHRPGAFILIEHEYLLIRIELRNDCGTVVQDALIHLLIAPSGAQVNFGLSGTPSADGYADYGTGNGPTDEELDGVANGTDGFLSWGGSLADPTWVGGASTNLGSYAFDNVYGGLLSHTVIWEDVSAGEGAGQAIPLGEFTQPGIPAQGGIYFNDHDLGYDPNNRDQGFFLDNYTALLGKVFKVTLSGTGVCNQNPSKSGYFRLIPGGKYWLVDPNQGTHTTLSHDDQSLSIYPNPTHGLITLDFDAGADTEGMIQILDINGKVVSESAAISIIKGKNVLNKDVSHLTSGTYVVQIVNNDMMMNKQFMKID